MAVLGVSRSARSLGMPISTPDPSTLRHVHPASPTLKCARAFRAERLTREAATWLHVSDETVKVHVKHILEKLAATEHAHTFSSND
jgi:hypothetical protein